MFGSLFDAYIRRLDTALGAAAGLTNALQDPFLAMGTIYVMLWGYLMMSGRIQEPVSDVIGRVVRLAFIGALVTNVGFYNTNVGNFFLNTVPCWIVGGAIGGSACGSGASAGGLAMMVAVDRLWGDGSAACLGLWNSSGFTDVGSKFVAALGWLVVGACSVLVAFQVVIVISLLKIVVFVGPLFIAMALFDRTSGFFMSWLNKLAFCTVSILLLMLASTIMLGMLTQTQTLVTTQNPLLEFAGTLLGLVVSTALFLAVPAIATALAGSGGAFQGFAPLATGTTFRLGGFAAAGSLGAASGAMRAGFNRFVGR